MTQLTSVILTHFVALKGAAEFGQVLCMAYKTCETLLLGWCVEHNSRVLRSTTKCDPIHSSDPYTFGHT